MELLSMKTNDFKPNRQRPIRAALVAACMAGVLCIGPVSAQEAELVEILRSARSGDVTPISPSGPPIITTTNVLETVLVEGDVLWLGVVNEPVLSMERAEIAKGGAIHHPLLGELKLVGKTLEQAQLMIHEILAADYLVDPRVSLRIIEYAHYEFSVVGQVQRQGNYSLPRNREIEVPQALMLAGGPTRLGSRSAEVDRIVDGERKTISVDLRPGRGEPVKVRHGDTIRMGERWF
jgi:protein involved in polysaccharide export with SLBB domain